LEALHSQAVQVLEWEFAMESWTKMHLYASWLIHQRYEAHLLLIGETNRVIRGDSDHRIGYQAGLPMGRQ